MGDKKPKDKKFVDETESTVVLENNAIPHEIARQIMYYTIDEIMEWLRAEIGNNPKLERTWKKAEAWVRELKASENWDRRGLWDNVPEEYMIALTCYTFGTGFYRMLNNESRSLTLSTWKSFRFRGFYSLLVRALARLQTDPEQRPLYRGMRIGVNLPGGVGSVVCFSQFTSTSLNENTARTFLAQNGGGTLIQIVEPHASARYIAELSKYPDQEEVLVWPWCRFKVLSIRKDADSGITLVQMKPDQGYGMDLVDLGLNAPIPRKRYNLCKDELPDDKRYKRHDQDKDGGAGSTAMQVANATVKVLNYAPIIGTAIDYAKGIDDFSKGNYGQAAGQFAIGTASLGLDLLTFGAFGSVTKLTGKAIAKVGAKAGMDVLVIKPTEKVALNMAARYACKKVTGTDEEIINLN